MNTGIFLKINSWAGQHGWLDRLMVFSAEELGYFMILGLFVFLFVHQKRYRDMAVGGIISAVISRFILVAIIRYFYHHSRPFDVLQNVNLLVERGREYSFPSGHAAFYFAMAMFVYLYNKKAGWAYFAGAALMGFSRVYIGVHWPFDILGGAILGMLVAVLIHKAYFRVQKILGDSHLF